MEPNIEHNIAPLRDDETDYTCPNCHTLTNFEDESNLLRRWNFRGMLGERDWLELWRCPVCLQRYILRNGD
jgi:hypothetical protein